MKRTTGAIASLALASGALLLAPSAQAVDTLPTLPVNFTAPTGPFYVGSEITLNPVTLATSLPAWETYYGVEIWDRDPNAIGDWDGDGDTEPYYNYAFGHIAGDSDAGFDYAEPAGYDFAKSPWNAPRPGVAIHYTPTSADLGKYLVVRAAAYEDQPNSWDEDTQGSYSYHYSSWHAGPTLSGTYKYSLYDDDDNVIGSQTDPQTYGSPYVVVGTVQPKLLTLPAADTKAIAKVKGKTKAKVGATVAAAAPKKFAFGKVKVTYKWFANGVAIPKAKKSSLKLAKKYKGKTVTLVVTVSKPGFSPFTKTISFGKVKK